MSRIGIYPGTFDPITNGHIDIIKRSLKIVNKLIVAVSNDFSKDYLFFKGLYRCAKQNTWGGVKLH